MEKSCILQESMSESKSESESGNGNKPLENRISVQMDLSHIKPEILFSNRIILVRKSVGISD